MSSVASVDDISNCGHRFAYIYENVDTVFYSSRSRWTSAFAIAVREADRPSRQDKIKSQTLNPLNCLEKIGPKKLELSDT